MNASCVVLAGERFALPRTIPHADRAGGLETLLLGAPLRYALTAWTDAFLNGHVDHTVSAATCGMPRGLPQDTLLEAAIFEAWLAEHVPLLALGLSTEGGPRLPSGQGWRTPVLARSDDPEHAAGDATQ